MIVLTAERAVDQHSDRAQRLADAGAEVEVVPAGRTMRDGLARLAGREITSLVLEGGRRLHEAAWRSRVVDHVQIYVAPRTLGARAVPGSTGASCSARSNIAVCVRAARI